MAKKITRIAKLQFVAGQAKPGPELAGLGIDMPGFTRQFNDKTKERGKDIVPVIITAYDDRSFEFELKTTPASQMILKELNKESGSSVQSESIGEITYDQAKKIAEYKMIDLNTNDINQAAKQIIGTAKQMGVIVTNVPKEGKK